MVKHKMETTPTESSIAAGWKIMIEKYGCKTQCVPKQFRDVKLLVASNGLNLKMVPAEDRTDELCELAVRSQPSALEFVPREKRTREMCTSVFNKNMRSISDIPPEHLTDEMCRQYVSSGNATRCQLWALSKSFRTPELNHLAVKTHGINLQWLDESERTDELCLLALKTYGQAIKYFPQSSKLRSSVDVQLEAVKQDGCALRFIAEPTDEMYAAAVVTRGCMLEYVPREKWTRALIETALHSEGTALKFVDDRDDDLCRIAVFSNGPGRGWALKYVPESKRTVELCVEAVKVEPFAYTFVPDAIKAAIDFVEINPSVFRFVVKTFDNCKAFLKKYGETHRHLYQHIDEYIPSKFVCAELFE